MNSAAVDSIKPPPACSTPPIRIAVSARLDYPCRPVGVRPMAGDGGKRGAVGETPERRYACQAVRYFSFSTRDRLAAIVEGTRATEQEQLLAHGNRAIETTASRSLAHTKQLSSRYETA